MREIPILYKQRTHDEAIMTALCTDTSLTRKEEMALNRVRCYLEAFTMADIVTGDGTRICPNAYNGIKPMTASIFDWHEERPTVSDIAL